MAPPQTGSSSAIGLSRSGVAYEVPRDIRCINLFPLGLLATTVIFDLIYLLGGGLIAAPFGWIDWFGIPPGTRANSIDLWHGAGNVVVMLLFVASWFVRHDRPARPVATALVLSFMGAGLALLTGWLGGELVDRLGVGVDDGAHLHAPSSLSRRPIC